MSAVAIRVATQSEKQMYFASMESPVGPLFLAGTGDALHFVGFAASRRAMRLRPGWKSAAEPFGEVQRQLRAYFARELREFDLPLALDGSEFQLAVWNRLKSIPYGETTSYGKIARDIGKPDAARAVGLANGQNPIPIIIPCHRVIGSDGSLTGFGGGLPIKERLLRLENPQTNLF